MAMQLGIGLTMAQLEDVGTPAMLERLVNSGRHLLAFRAAQVLGLGTEQVNDHPSPSLCPGGQGGWGAECSGSNWF